MSRSTVTRTSTELNWCSGSFDPMHHNLRTFHFERVRFGALWAKPVTVVDELGDSRHKFRERIGGRKHEQFPFVQFSKLAMTMRIGTLGDHDLLATWTGMGLVIVRLLVRPAQT